MSMTSLKSRAKLRRTNDTRCLIPQEMCLIPPVLVCFFAKMDSFELKKGDCGGKMTNVEFLGI